MDRRPIQNSFFRPHPRQGSRLEHGRRRPSRVSFRSPPNFVGLLQATLRASHQPAHRSSARNPRHVSRCAPERRNHVAESRHFRRPTFATRRDFWPRASHRHHFFLRNWSPGSALQFCPAFYYPSGQQRAPGAPPPFRSRHQRRSCTSACRSEEHTSELQSHLNLVCRLLLEKKKTNLVSENHSIRGSTRDLENSHE